MTFPDPHPYVTEGLGPPTMLLGPTDGVDVEGLVAVAEGTAKSGGRVTSFWAAQVLASRPWVVLVMFFVGWGNVDWEGGGAYIGAAEVLDEAEGSAGAAPYYESVLVKFGVD